MRPLTNNERFLLTLLSMVAIVLVSIMGLKWINETQTKLNLQVQQAIADRSIAEVQLEEQDVAQQRLLWISQHEIPIGDNGVAQGKLLESLRSAADKNKLVIQQQSVVGEVEHGPAGVSITASMEAKGSMESIIRWINTFQSVSDFYAIEKCSLKVDSADPKTVIGSLTIRKYFKDI